MVARADSRLHISEARCKVHFVVGYTGRPVGRLCASRSMQSLRVREIHKYEKSNRRTLCAI